MAHEISLTVAGKTHSDWMSYRIESDLDVPADAFDFTLASSSLILPPECQPHADVMVHCANQMVMHGRIDDVHKTLSKNKKELRILGRDLARELVDCSAPIFSKRDIQLSDAIKLICNPLGIKKVKILVSGKKSKLHVEPGQTAWSILDELARKYDAGVWFEPDGILKIGKPDYETKVVGTLFLSRENPDQSNCEAITIKSSGAQAFSDITVLGQGHASEKKRGIKHKGKAKRGTKRGKKGKGRAKAPPRPQFREAEKNRSVTVYRPKIINTGGADNADEVDAEAERAMQDAELSELEINVTVRGHLAPNNKVWVPGTRCAIKCDALSIDGIYFLMGRTLACDKENGRTTELRFKQDKVWLA